jgi:hypothetical protein
MEAMKECSVNKFERPRNRQVLIENHDRKKLDMHRPGAWGYPAAGPQGSYV